MAHGGGQVPVFCSLCEEDTRITWKCLNCDMLMCDKCKEKIHVKFKFAKDHKVVSIEELGLHEDEIDLSNINCKTHAGQTCVLFCQSCVYLVCPLCISETHNGHGLVTIKEGYEILISKLKTRGKNIGTNIHELEKRKEEVKDVDRAELSQFENTLKKIKDQNVQLKKEVDQHTKKLETELIKKWEDLHRCTETEEKEVSLLIESLASKKSVVDDIIQSNDGKRIFVDGLELVQSMEETVTSPCSKFDSIPTFLPGEITAYNIGSLENVSTKGEIKIIKQFDTEISNVMFMAACSEDTLWITNQEVLQKVKIEGRSLKIIDQKNIKIYGMACTPSEDLLLVTAGGSVLKQISGQTGEMTDSKYKVKGFVLSTVHVNSDGKVTTGAYSGEIVYPAVGRRVVVVMDKSGKHDTTIEYDTQGKSIFTYVMNITRTNNGNICVVDQLSEDWRGRVVILSEDGDVLNTFNGNPEVNTDKIPFEPIYVLTTPFDNIIVSNRNHNILYFLNNSGNYIRYCDTRKPGILYPRPFCSTEAGHTYVGCVTPIDSSDKAKIYEVDIL
ncbi:uncharacterized protein LOC127724561 [Mytilus californianus]|uniref:uncharacterized protein LOC127724561 n=1 Tax=Mytilus californianus TaxID=6549 RepID=UPI00224518B4|nr:uncharacterized protein LOC127724561 [Mytilus californianus]